MYSTLVQHTAVKKLSLREGVINSSRQSGTAEQHAAELTKSRIHFTVFVVVVVVTHHHRGKTQGLHHGQRENITWCDECEERLPYTLPSAVRA